MRYLHGKGPLFTALLATVLLVAGVAAAEERVDRTVDAAARGTVAIENLAGEVLVTGWDRNEVRLTGTLDDQVEKLIFERDGDDVLIRVKYPQRARDIEGSFLEVQVPEGSRLEVETVSGEIGVRGVRGRVEAQSVSGDVEVAGEPEEVEAQTISGQVIVTAASDRIAVHSVSGDLEVDGARGELSAETVSGEIMVSGARFDRFEASSVSGDVEFRGELDPDAEVEIDSHSGDVVLLLAGDVNAEFDVETFSGDVDNAFGQRAERTSKYAPGQELEFTVGDGGARVRINTFSGDVQLRRR